MVRGVGKRGKQKRGGGRHFTKDMVLDEDGVAQSRKRTEEDDDSDEEEDSDEENQTEEKKVEESSEEEEDEEDEGDEPKASSSTTPPAKQVRIAKKPAVTTAEEEEDPDLVNPNRAAMKNLKLSDVDAPRQMSRREKEQKEKADAQARYWKLHQAGKTDQAKADLARLAKIKQDRADAEAKRKAEANVKAAEIEAKKAKSTQKR